MTGDEPMTTIDYAAEVRAAYSVDDLAALCIQHADAPLADTARGARFGAVPAALQVHPR